MSPGAQVPRIRASIFELFCDKISVDVGVSIKSRDGAKLLPGGSFPFWKGPVSCISRFVKTSCTQTGFSVGASILQIPSIARVAFASNALQKVIGNYLGPHIRW